MNDVLKQRLVGALILVALGVIFWPIIFIEPERGDAAMEARIPPRPGVETTPLPSPDKVGLRESPSLLADDSAEGEQLVHDSLPVPDPQDSPLVDAEPAPPVPDPQSGAAGDATAADNDVAIPTRDRAPESPELDAQGVPVAWMLQVVSLSNKTSAEQAAQRLQDLGHKAYVKAAQVNGRMLYRVYVGPKFERGRLESIQGAIDQEFGVKSMIRRYYP